MEIVNVGIAGTVESSDIMITIERAVEPGIRIDLNSTVEKQFGQQIRQVIKECLEELEIANAYVAAVDKGALDYAIRARVFSAAYRACKCKDYYWRTSP